MMAWTDLYTKRIKIRFNATSLMERKMSEDIKKERLKQIKEKYERDKSQITLRYKAQSDAMAARKKGELEELKDRYKMSVEGVEHSQNIRDGQKKPN